MVGAAIDRASGITHLGEIAERKYPWRPVVISPEQVFGIYIDRMLQLHGFSRKALREWGGGDMLPMRPSVATGSGPRVMKP